MRMFTKLLGASAALAAAAPAAAQYYSPYSGYGQTYGQSYGYAQPYAQTYGQTYGYAQPYGYAQTYAVNTNLAARQCTSAVQSRLYNRSSIGGILGAVLGTSSTGRVVAITQASPRSNGTVRVRGLASSGRYAMNGYGAYGVGAYGAAGYGYTNQADLSFRCDVGMNGQIYDVSINRRY